MPKKIILILLGFAFLFGFKSAYAEVVINEIMYAPVNGSSYEWVEIFNSGSLPIDLQGWRFFHGESNSGPLTLRNGNTTILQPLEYAIIAKSPSVVTNYTWLNFSGMILSASTLSLPDGVDNTYIAIASDIVKTISNSVIYNTSLGGDKDSGNSLQKKSGSWVAATPTPGKENKIVDTPPSSDEENNDPVVSVSVPSTQGPPESKTKTAEIPKVKTKISAKNLAFVGIPIEFSASATGYSSEPLFYGKYFWNFGDGDSKEMQANETAKFTHTFFYEGEYTVALEYYMNYYSNSPDAYSEMNVRIIPANIFISRVGDEKDFFVEISNNTDYDADLSKWILTSGEKNFILPKNTVLQPRKKMILSPKITGFSISDKDTLKLENPQGEIIFNYSTPIEPVKILAKKSVSVRTSLLENKSENLSENNTQTEIPASTSASLGGPADNLLAQTIQSDIPVEDVGNNLMYGIGLFGLLGISTGAAYFIRIRNRKISTNTIGNDFEIIDE